MEIIIGLPVLYWRHESEYFYIHDGRHAGSVSYYWIHTSSVFYTGYKIICFCFELTRNTDHLRDFYGNDFKGHMTSDAYVSYPLYASEQNGRVINTWCFMHARRRIVAARLLSQNGYTDEQLASTPEFIAIGLIRDIYLAENPLKDLSAEERLRRRQSEVKPKVDAYFNYLKSLDQEDPTYIDYLSDAIQYSLNHEKGLREFLNDPLVPCDNGFAERSIRSISNLRKNALFSYSVTGAEDNAILQSIAETAKANGANPRHYFQYILDRMSKAGSRSVTDTAFLEEMMPWSESFKAYEKGIINDVCQLLDQGQTSPPDLRKRSKDSDAARHQEVPATA